MQAFITLALSAISFLVANRAQIVTLIQGVEALIPDAPGAVKAAQVKAFIAAGLGAEAQLEQAWPLVAPLFDLLVAAVKGKAPQAAAAPA